MYTLHGERVNVKIAKYGNKRPAILIEDEMGLPYMTASINVPQLELKDDEVVIKDYSENEGVYEWLLERNIIQPLHRVHRVGMDIGCPVCVLNPKDEWNEQSNLSMIDDYID